MRFDVIVTNPPFQDRTERKRTPHKLWIDFTEHSLEHLLQPDGLLLQVSPASFQSPSNRVLKLMREHRTEMINFDVAHHFPGVGSSFSYYAIRTQPPAGSTAVTKDGVSFDIELDAVRWLPQDITEESLSIHRKVMWDPTEHLTVLHDYVVCHNIRLGTTLSKTETAEHVYPVFHTNSQTWFSSAKQPWASKKKVMWSRSGYTKPRVDTGKMGGTDMVYYVTAPTVRAAKNLQHNLTLPLFQYLFRSAKWSGFGNELVFESLPSLPLDVALTHQDLCELFGLTDEEVAYVERHLG